MAQTKSAVTYNGKSYTLDHYGFLHPPEQWDENFANGIAGSLGIYGGLTKKHWDFIRYLRKKLTEEKKLPTVINACAENKVRLKKFRLLFPTGYHRGACKIAGINYEFMCESKYCLCSYEIPPSIRADYKISPLGFLEDFDQWDERFAFFVIREWNLPQGLTERHREIIRFLRGFYERNKDIPTIFETCKATRLTLEELEELFPDGYQRGACRIAGLPFLA